MLPFHGVVHKLMPLCNIVMNAVTDHHDETTPPAKHEPVKRVTGVAPSAFRVVSLTVQRADPIASPAAYRSFMSLGAMRCDRDVGLHLLVETFRI